MCMTQCLMLVLVFVIVLTCCDLCYCLQEKVDAMSDKSIEDYDQEYPPVIFKTECIASHTEEDSYCSYCTNSELDNEPC